MTKRSPRAVGTAAESAVVAWCRDNGWPQARRQPLYGNKDQGDIIICEDPRILIECKAGAMAENASDTLIRTWLEQTETERRNAGAQLGVLVVRRFRRPAGLWDAWMDAASWMHLIDGQPWGTAEAPWPLRASLADFSDMARQWVQR